MRKLTTEQSEFIIEQMTKQRNEPYWNALIGPNEFEFMKKIINQCAEIPFPGFMLFQETDNAFIDVSKNMSKDNEEREESQTQIFITIGNGAWNTDSYIMIDHNVFKILTDKCNKIVEWINNAETN